MFFIAHPASMAWMMTKSCACWANPSRIRCLKEEQVTTTNQITANQITASQIMAVSQTTATIQVKTTTSQARPNILSTR